MSYQKKLNCYREKDSFSLGRMYFTGSYGYHNILPFAPMVNPLTLDSNKKVTNSATTGISP